MTDTSNNLLGKKLRELRGDKSLYSVGKAIGIDRSHIRRYESGEMLPTYEKLLKLADYYGVEHEVLAFPFFDANFTKSTHRNMIFKWCEARKKNAEI